jgi:hypothetical protein
VTPKLRATAHLQRTEEWLVGVITHGGELGDALAASPHGAALGVRAVAELGRVVRGTPAHAEERLAIYRSGFRARLLECLTDDYPAVAHALGEEGFDALVREYVAAHPPSGATLNAYGKAMPAFLRDEEMPGASAERIGTCPRAFLVELATLEWTIVEAIHAPPSPVLTQADAARVPPEAWGAASFWAAPAARLVTGTYPVSAYYGAVRAGARPALPAPQPSATLVHRRDRTVWRFELVSAKCALLASLFDGVPLGDAMAALEALDDPPPPEAIGPWFQEWVSGGVFGGVTLHAG